MISLILTAIQQLRELHLEAFEKNKGGKYYEEQRTGDYVQTDLGAKYAEVIYKKHFYCRTMFKFKWRKEIADKLAKEMPELDKQDIEPCYCPTDEENLIIYVRLPSFRRNNVKVAPRRQSLSVTLVT